MYKKMLLLIIIIPFFLVLRAQGGDPMVLVANPNWISSTAILPLSDTVDAVIDWGDGHTKYVYKEGIYSHDYGFSSNDTIIITITGMVTHFGDSLVSVDNRISSCISEIVSWGNVGIRNLSYAASNSEISILPDSLPAKVTDLSYMFYENRVIKSGIDNWDVSNITNMSAMFYNADSLNIDLDNWDVSNVIDMSMMFRSANLFNGDISSWDVSGVTDMSYMFCSVDSFNCNIGNWDVSNVTNMSHMFQDAERFNGDISGWDVSKVTDFSRMFLDAYSFNSDISLWDVSNAVTMREMFSGAINFDSDIGNWNISNVANLFGMFRNANKLNCDLSNWDVSNVSNMMALFASRDSVNSGISNWDVSNVTDMSYMFSNADSFEDISHWDVSSVITMQGMFMEARSFDCDISNWDVSNVSDMSYMFYGADSFNVDINSWDVSNVSDMSYMFYSADSFNVDINSWDVSSVTSMDNMFAHAYSFDRCLDNWDVSSVTEMPSMFQEVKLSTNNYSNMLIKWAELPLQQGVHFNGGKSNYNDYGANARSRIINTYGWSFYDGDLESILSNFSAELVDSAAMLNWEVNSIVNDSGFVVQRAYSLDGEDIGWNELGFIKADSNLSYLFTDNTLTEVADPLGTAAYYRLCLVSLEGITAYLDTVMIDISILTGVDEMPDVPAEFALSQNYPNPFNPTTTINYNVAENSNVSIKVYNMLGQEVMTLVNEMKSPGTYNVKMDGSQLASGIYIYRMTAGNFSSVKKFVLMK